MKSELSMLWAPTIQNALSTDYTTRLGMVGNCFECKPELQDNI